MPKKQGFVFKGALLISAKKEEEEDINGFRRLYLPCKRVIRIKNT